MKLHLLLSASLALLSAATGVLSNEIASAVAKPSQDFDSEIVAVADEAIDLDDGEDEFDEEEGGVKEKESKSRKKRRKKRRYRRYKKSKKYGKYKKNKRYRRRRYRRYRRNRRYRNYYSSGYSSSYSSASNDFDEEDSKINQQLVLHVRQLCGGDMSAEDAPTCDRLESEFCNTGLRRGSNRSMCRYFGFRAIVEGMRGDDPETYADVSETYLAGDADEYEMIIEDIEYELKHGANDESMSMGDMDHDDDYNSYDEDSETKDFDGSEDDEDDEMDEVSRDERGRDDRYGAARMSAVE